MWFHLQALVICIVSLHFQKTHNSSLWGIVCFPTKIFKHFYSKLYHLVTRLQLIPKVTAKHVDILQPSTQKTVHGQAVHKNFVPQFH